MENPFSEPLATEDPTPSLPKPTMSVKRPVWQFPLAYILMAAGVLIFAVGFPLFTRNPATNEEQSFGFLVLGIGVALGSAGVSLRFLRPIYAPFAAIAGPTFAWIIATIFIWACLILNGIIRRFL